MVFLRRRGAVLAQAAAGVGLVAGGLLFLLGTGAPAASVWLVALGGAAAIGRYLYRNLARARRGAP